MKKVRTLLSPVIFHSVHEVKRFGSVLSVASSGVTCRCYDKQPIFHVSVPVEQTSIGRSSALLLCLCYTFCAYATTALFSSFLQAAQCILYGTECFVDLESYMRGVSWLPLSRENETLLVIATLLNHVLQTRQWRNAEKVDHVCFLLSRAMKQIPNAMSCI